MTGTVTRELKAIDGKEPVSCAASQSGIRPFAFFLRTVLFYAD
jgi:hypothetical protein